MRLSERRHRITVAIGASCGRRRRAWILDRMTGPSLEIKSPSHPERQAALAQVQERWGTIVVSRGVVHTLALLPMLVAVRGALVGCLTYRHDGPSIEVVTLDAFIERQGVGTALFRAVLGLARKVWLVTTNDNLCAQSFYRSQGGTLVAVHVGAVAYSRKLKPSIPTHGRGGLPIADELQYEW